MFRVEELSYRYPGSKRGIENISFSFAPGEITTLIGESGIGKSTLLACIAGILTPDSGRIVREDHVELRHDRDHSSSLILQNSALFDSLFVWENVALAWGAPSRRNRVKARRVLDGFGVKDLADSRPTELSLGQRQRVAIASALASEPQVLLADEPTGSLDNANTQIVLETLKESTRGGVAVVIVTHDEILVSAADIVFHLSKEGITAR